MESNWNDELSLKNPKELFAIIDKYPKVKAILWGHAHQAKEFRHNDIKLISCPSTALQFNEEKRIGFNHYFLGKNGELTYKTCWINNHL
jgi:Icc protein